MLSKPSENISECLAEAERCRRLSQTAPSPEMRKVYAELESKWMSLARSYETSERMGRFLNRQRSPLNSRPESN